MSLVEVGKFPVRIAALKQKKSQLFSVVSIQCVNIYLTLRPVTTTTTTKTTTTTTKLDDDDDDEWGFA